MGKIKIISAGRIPEIIAPQRCSGCGRCIAACPKKLYAFELVNHRKHSINIAPESCSRCDRCILACPLEIISGETVTP